FCFQFQGFGPQGLASTHGHHHPHGGHGYCPGDPMNQGKNALLAGNDADTTGDDARTARDDARATRYDARAARDDARAVGDDARAVGDGARISRNNASLRFWNAATLLNGSVNRSKCETPFSD
ncbi:hypothetical protein FGIG_01367, partial [Fasciola gigantica]